MYIIHYIGELVLEIAIIIVAAFAGTAKLARSIIGLVLCDGLLATPRSLATKLSGVMGDNSRQPITDKIITTMRNHILSLYLSMHSTSQNSHVYTQ